jgi:uncharacterized membrane protein (UPF0127 family)
VKGRSPCPVAGLVVGLAGFMLTASARAAPCETVTAALQQMEDSTVILSGDGEERLEIPVKIADDVNELAAGFQHICPEDIGDTAILFRFGVRTETAFHMHNVQAPLDIAHIDASGLVIDVQRMEPYVNSVVFVNHPLYRPAGPFMSALETAAGRLERLGIRVGSRIVLK